jgi:hypothetical protein
MATNININLEGRDLVERAKQQQRDARTNRLTREAITTDAATNRETLLGEPTAASQVLAPTRSVNTDTEPYIRVNRPAATRVLVKADYYVITYGFESPGRDLDTRTQLVFPETNALSDPIGWCKTNDISYAGRLLVEWGGDNTGFGVESVLVDRKAYEEVLAGPIRLKLSAFWFSIPNTQVLITVTGYKGGTMVPVPSDYTWANPTADRVWQNFSSYTSRSVVTNIGGCIDGDFIAYLTIYYTAGKISYSSAL